MGLLDKLKGLFKKEEGKVVEEAEDVKKIVVKEVDDAKMKIIEDELNNEQLVIKELYERDGLTDEVLDKQVALNQRRNELDIPDKTTLNSDGWSQ